MPARPMGLGWALSAPVGLGICEDKLDPARVFDQCPCAMWGFELSPNFDLRCVDLIQSY